MPPSQSSSTIDGGKTTVNWAQDVMEVDTLACALNSPDDTSTLMRWNCVAVDFKNGLGQPSGPEVLLRGTGWTADGSKVQYTAFNDTDGDVDRIRSDLSKQLHFGDGSVGARLREEHLVGDKTLVIGPPE